jgi:hypothetical protein
MLLFPRQFLPNRQISADTQSSSGNHKYDVHNMTASMIDSPLVAFSDQIAQPAADRFTQWQQPADQSGTQVGRRAIETEIPEEWRNDDKHS